MTDSPTWSDVTRADVLRAIKEYDRLGPERFFSEHGFARTTTYELVWNKRRYPPKAILGTVMKPVNVWSSVGKAQDSMVSGRMPTVLAMSRASRGI